MQNPGGPDAGENSWRLTIPCQDPQATVASSGEHSEARGLDRSNHQEQQEQRCPGHPIPDTGTS